MSFHLFNEALGKEKDNPREREKGSHVRRRKEHPHTWEEERHFQQEEKRDELGHKKLRGFCFAAAQKSRRTVQGRTVQAVRTGVHIYCCSESAVPCCTEIEEVAVQIAKVF